MEKRTLIAVLLSIAILIGYQFFFAPPPPTQKPVKEPEGIVEKEGRTEKTMVSPVKPMNVPSASVAEKEIIVDTDLYSAALTSVGGTVKKWELKKYTDKEGLSVVLQKGQSVVRPLSIMSQNNFHFSEINFRVLGKDLKLDKNSPTGSLIFEYATPEYSVRRTFTFYNNKYKFDLKDEVIGLPEYWLAVGNDFGIYNRKDDSAHIGPILLKDTDRIEVKASKLQEPKVFQNGLKWIANEDKYFFAGIVPASPMDEAKAWKIKDAPVIAIKGKPGVNEFLIYAGPKEHDRLKELNVGLEHIIDFGFFSIISRPLFWLLKLFYNFMGNYGWAIVLLTIVTRIPFIPLINKSQKAMKKMQEIQPKMAELKEKYKNDPQKMQKELMAMYKKHQVNPLGGCLPMLLQIPVFFALYKILSIAIELRGAPFMLWITDLSVKDPYYILPIVMGITMVIQQKMTPSSMDPKQAKIMMFMPVIFTFLFLNFASGLVLYWLVNNILSIIQQFFVNKKLEREKHKTN